MNRIDLHMHSIYSDGAMAPAELARYAGSLGLEAIALTDHDSIGGVPEAIEAGARAGVEVLPGVELALKWRDKSIDILGYMFDLGSRPLEQLLAKKKQFRLDRARRIVARVAELGYPLEWEEVIVLTDGGVVTQPHVASALVRKGFFNTPAEVFDTLLGRGKPGYVEGEGDCLLAEGIEALHASGGVAVIAHPYIPECPDYMDIPAFVEDAVREGIDGIEAYYTGYTEEMTRTIQQIAAANGLIVSGGSDYHGGQQVPHCKLACVHVPEESLQAIKARARRYAASS